MTVILYQFIIFSLVAALCSMFAISDGSWWWWWRCLTMRCLCGQLGGTQTVHCRRCSDKHHHVLGGGENRQTEYTTDNTVLITKSAYHSQTVRSSLCCHAVLFPPRRVRNRLRLFGVYHKYWTWLRDMLNVILKVWERERRKGKSRGECCLSKCCNPRETIERASRGVLVMLMCTQGPGRPASTDAAPQPDQWMVDYRSTFICCNTCWTRHTAIQPALHTRLLRAVNCIVIMASSGGWLNI